MNVSKEEQQAPHDGVFGVVWQWREAGLEETCNLYAFSTFHLTGKAIMCAFGAPSRARRLVMVKQLLSLAALAAVSLALGACAESNVAIPDWNRPFKPMTGPAPVFLHNLAIANPPYPHDSYPNFEDEPTRFIFHPRNVTYDETDNGTGGDQGFVSYPGGDQGGGGE